MRSQVGSVSGLVKKSFASDNYSGVHPDIMQAMQRVNVGHVASYGFDSYTEQALEKFKGFFGNNIEVHFVFLGTAANVLSLHSVLKSYEAILCADCSHINVDECGAPERYAGKLLTVPNYNGKLKVEDLKPYLHQRDFVHNVQPRVISITQCTEKGTVYSIDEIKEITEFAHKNDLIVHMDGARLSNAAVTLNAEFIEMTNHAGVDILSFGGTKNGMMYGEAVIFFRPELAKGFKYIKKQGMQLVSKTRFISAQFDEFLSNDLWRRNAQNANNMAMLLAEKLQPFKEIKITNPVESNSVFAVVPQDIIEKLQDSFPFYVWDFDANEVRWMTAFDTTEEDINQFVNCLQALL